MKLLIKQVLAGTALFCVVIAVWHSVNTPRLVRSPYFSATGEYVGSVDFSNPNDLKLFLLLEGEEKKRFEQQFIGEQKSAIAMFAGVVLLALYVVVDLTGTRKVEPHAGQVSSEIAPGASANKPSV